jgi:DNA-binding transcriptional LysR family regulator
MDPEVRLLRYFLAVAEELNFTRAAERLHVAQPSLSAQIRQLEAQLGARLLHRTTRAVSLTDAGEALRARGPQALAGLEQAWQAARDAGRGVVGTLRLAYTLSAGHETVPRLIESMHQTHPGITVVTDVLPTPRVVAAVQDGAADAGVARTPALADGVRLLTIRRDPEGILVGAGHPLAGRRTVTLHDIAGHPVVLHPRAANPAHHDFIRQLFAERDLHPSFVERDIAFDLSQRFITEGTAVELVGRSTTARLPPDVRWIPLAEPIAVTVALVLPAGEWSPAVQHFEAVARGYALAHGWLDHPDCTAAPMGVSGGSTERGAVR